MAAVLPLPEAPHAGAPNTAEHRYPIEFTASAAEYFRIWIVNLALTIVTLGIYSAWAKVRRNRYFYSHTRLDGEGFEYRARPLSILKGRLIAAALIAAFYASGHFFPLLQLVFFIAALFVVPWLIVRSYAFNAFNSAYRGLRFHFHGTYKACLKRFLGYLAITVVTFGLGYFWFRARMAEFIARNHAYGSTRFHASLLGDYLRAYLYAFLLGALAGVGVLVAMLGMGLAAGAKAEAGPAAAFGVFGFIAIAGMYLAYLFVFAYLRARLGNATFNNLSAGPVSFRCTLRARDMALLYTVNIIAVIVTLGLATPWAVVRTMRYRASRLTVVAVGSLAGFTADEAAKVSAAGEEVGEMFDLDLGI